MDNQHRKISGYRELSQEEIDLMNEIKAKGEELRALVAKISDVAIPKPQAIEAAPDGTVTELIQGEAYDPLTAADRPEFWLNWADSSFRSGIMYAVRAVAKPQTY